MLDGMTGSALTFPILIGDIGGTNARFSILHDAGHMPADVMQVATADYASIELAIQTAVLPALQIAPRSALLAIAAPVDGDEIALTNCGWTIKPKEMLQSFNLGAVVLLNDFEAQALAAASLSENDRVEIGSVGSPKLATRIVLGPGTGLGVAGLLRAGNSWLPLAGEGGHVDLGPRSDRDHEIFPHLNRIAGRVSAEEILSGRGLSNLYKAICAADGVEPTVMSPAAITECGLSGQNKQAAETITLFLTYLGRIAGDLALTFMARGGVFIAGGIAPRIMDAFKSGRFREAFEDKAPHQHLMASIPSYILTHPQAALAGLAKFASMPEDYAIAIKDRQWDRR